MNLFPSQKTPCHWDGAALLGVNSKRITATVPARLVACHLLHLPDAPLAQVRAAARLRAQDAFPALGPVAVDAIIHPAKSGQRAVLLLALPQATVARIRQAAGQAGAQLKAIRIAELQAAPDANGLLHAHGEVALAQADRGFPLGLTPLGPADSAGFKARQTEATWRKLPADAYRFNPASCAALDFLRPPLQAKPSPLAGRTGRMAAIIACLLTVAGAFAGVDACNTLQEHDELAEHAGALEKQTRPLVAKRADCAEMAPWFEKRPSLFPELSALTLALPETKSPERVRFNRIHLAPGQRTKVEGTANQQADLMAFLDRLRKNPRVVAAEVHSFRNKKAGAAEVSFELSFQLKPESAHAPRARKQKATPPTFLEKWLADNAAKPATKPEAKPEAKPDAKPKAQPGFKLAPKPAVPATPTPVAP